MQNKHIHLLFFLLTLVTTGSAQKDSLRILNFQGDNGFQHDSKVAALNMINAIGNRQGWKIINSFTADDLNPQILSRIDVVIFNNNCGNAGPILNSSSREALQGFIRNGGGFVGIHCAGAIWNEGGGFQTWYESLVGARMVDHPEVQTATLRVDNPTHPITRHLPKEWEVTDEWHRFSSNPREQVNVLLALDENSYKGEQKMQGDHPFTWYQYFDGGRSFFTSLGHTEQIYHNPDFLQLVQAGIEWAGRSSETGPLPVTDGLLIDLDAQHAITLEDGDRIRSWKNSAPVKALTEFVKQDLGREVPGSGRPRIRLNNPKIKGLNSVVFHRQELLNQEEDILDTLTTGAGYTWFSVMSVYEQVPDVPGVNSFFGNLRNSNLDGEGKYEGFWAGLSDDNRVWMGSRNALTFGRWDENNPQVLAPERLETNRFYLVMGRMEAGTGTVRLELFINEADPIAAGFFPVNPNADPSRFSIGQERDATNHPGKESFDGEIARFLLFKRSLSYEELKLLREYFVGTYDISTNP